MNHSTTEPLLLTYPDAARLLSLSIPTLERLVRKQKIPFLRIGRSVRFQRATLQAWITAQEKREATGEE